MTTVARRVAATPSRSASQAWSVIVDILAPTPGPARTELQGIAGIASCLVAEEAMKSDACVVYGSGPRVRLYCLYDEDAIIGENLNEAALTFTATDGDWKMSLPCHQDDLDWVKKALEPRATHVVARELGAAVDDDESPAEGPAKGAVIKKEAFLRS